MGFYNTPKPFMDKFREMIKAKLARFLAMVAFLNQNSCFVVEGERYKSYLWGIFLLCY